MKPERTFLTYRYYPKSESGEKLRKVISDLDDAISRKINGLKLSKGIFSGTLDEVREILSEDRR